MHATNTTRRRFLGFGAAAGSAVLFGTASGGSTAVAAERGRRRTGYPDVLNLPNGFHPAGIGIGPAPYAYFGSLLGGAVYRASLLTGKGRVINPGLGEGYYAVGLQVDERQRVFVAGGWGRLITVMDGITGKVIQTYEVGNADTFVDHVVLTPRAAWFTDSFNGQLFGLPLGPRGALPTRDQVVTLKLGGEWTQGPSDGLTATGIAATPDGSALVVVNIHAHGGSLFRVAPTTGDARRIDLGRATLPTTNGILVHGRTLYAPRMNDLAVLRLDPTGHNARLVRTVTDPRFETPCAAAIHGNRIYLPNSRFPQPPQPDLPYNAVALSLPL
ncbi:superoxide dismutase [Streptomyces sp. NPDC048389]|uniref:superoxide dismutase n=1 Tax=Streptomyces sp. NPDC048389 TaxID=3154622 RepID=UPI0034528402